MALSAVLEQQSDHLQVAAHRRLVKRPGSFSRVDVEAELDQECDAPVAARRSRQERVDLVVLPRRARLDEQRHDLQVTRQRRLLHGRASLIDRVS